jgi:predicted phosphate transport protein (TIGR00153 family)
MFGRFMPREVKFFDLFNAHTKEIVRGADALVAVMAALNQSPEAAAAHAATLDTIEERADKITEETMAMLHATFITPLDRDEIHQLIKHLDDVLDTIQDAAGTITTYDIRRATPEAIRFAEIIRASVELLEKAVGLLHNMDNGSQILSACSDISKLETEADLVLREAMSKLFREEPDVRELIKLKVMYELLETVTDCCKRVANILESIVLENS